MPKKNDDQIENAQQPRQHYDTCESCGKETGPYNGVSLGSPETGYRNLCMRCYNEEAAKQAGVRFTHPDFAPIRMKGKDRKEHTFRFSTHLFGNGVSIDAFEVKDDQPEGYHFQVIEHDPEGDLRLLHKKLMKKMQRALAQKHIKPSKIGGLQITKPWTVRAVIEGDYDHDSGDHRPVLVIDGKPVDWDQFGRMLMTFEGFQFKMQIHDLSEEC